MSGVYQKEKMIRSGGYGPITKAITLMLTALWHIFGNKYYWFGEHKECHNSSALVGVTCYSSTDLCNWTNEEGCLVGFG